MYQPRSDVTQPRFIDNYAGQATKTTLNNGGTSILK